VLGNARLGPGCWRLEAGTKKSRGDPIPPWSKCVNAIDKGVRMKIVVKAVDKGLTGALARLGRVNTKKGTTKFMFCQ
jgi:hypothetical protein